MGIQNHNIYWGNNHLELGKMNKELSFIYFFRYFKKEIENIFFVLSLSYKETIAEVWKNVSRVRGNARPSGSKQ